MMIVNLSELKAGGRRAENEKHFPNYCLCSRCSVFAFIGLRKRVIGKSCISLQHCKHFQCTLFAFKSHYVASLPTPFQKFPPSSYNFRITDSVSLSFSFSLIAVPRFSRDFWHFLAFTQSFIIYCFIYLVKCFGKYYIYDYHHPFLLHH